MNAQDKLKDPKDHDGTDIEMLMAWYQQFRQCNVEIMSTDQTKLMLNIMMSGDKMEQDPEISQLKTGFGYQVFDKRCRAMGITPTFKLCLFITQGLTHSPGDAVMFASLMKLWCHERGVDTMCIDEFCEIFPMGFPNHDELQRIWALQKCTNGNMLDVFPWSEIS